MGHTDLLVKVTATRTGGLSIGTSIFRCGRKLSFCTEHLVFARLLAYIQTLQLSESRVFRGRVFKKEKEAAFVICLDW